MATTKPAEVRTAKSQRGIRRSRPELGKELLPWPYAKGWKPTDEETDIFQKTNVPYIVMPYRLADAGLEDLEGRITEGEFDTGLFMFRYPEYVRDPDRITCLISHSYMALHRYKKGVWVDDATGIYMACRDEGKRYDLKRDRRPLVVTNFPTEYRIQEDDRKMFCDLIRYRAARGLPTWLVLGKHRASGQHVLAWGEGFSHWLQGNAKEVMLEPK